MNETIKNAVAVVITSTDHVFASPMSGLYVGGTGDVVLKPIGGAPVTFKAVPAGTTLRWQFIAVVKTSTTATLMVAGR